MNCFIFTKQPKSYNSRRSNSAGYKNIIVSAFRKFHGNSFAVRTGELYGRVYYFFKKKIGCDADNISKPIWDCLTGVLYQDDSQVLLRTAGCFDLSKSGIDVLDITRMPHDIMEAFLREIDKSDHVVYVECGKFDSALFEFGLKSI